MPTPSENNPGPKHQGVLLDASRFDSPPKPSIYVTTNPEIIRQAVSFASAHQLYELDQAVSAMEPGGRAEAYWTQEGREVRVFVRHVGGYRRWAAIERAEGENEEQYGRTLALLKQILQNPDRASASQEICRLGAEGWK